MTSDRVKCTKCNAMILPRTAEKYGGLCAPCHNTALLIVPKDFEMSPDLAQSLVSIGEKPKHYREMAWRDGSESVHRFIDSLEEENSLYHRWSPRLRMFAKKCREEHPPPTPNCFQYPLLDRRRALHN